MFLWLHKLGGAMLVLIIGAGPVCACPWMWNQQPAASPTATKHEMACCQEEKQPPPASSDRSCEHCPVMNPAHAVLDRPAAATHAPIHWIAWAAPLSFTAVMLTPLSTVIPSALSPPPIPNALVHLHCQLTT